MRLAPLYRLKFDYPESWAVALTGEAGKEEEHLLFAEGRAEGRITGRFRAVNSPHRRTDLTFESHFHGVLLTDDGGTVLVEYGGLGRAYREPWKSQAPERRQWVATASHRSDDPRYSWLNEVVCVGTGEVRRKLSGGTPSNPTDLLLDVAELIWEPAAD